MTQLVAVESKPISVFDEEHLGRIENLCHAKGLEEEDFKLFLFTAQRRGLDPLKNQICAVMRWSSRDRRQVMNVQTTIDGFRLIASRTGEHAGTSDVTYVYSDDGSVLSASVSTYRIVKGMRCEWSATAFFSEYVVTDKSGKPTRFWEKMGKHMIGKCAEALCLRKAFPEELSGLYTDDEMDQAGDILDSTSVASPPPPSKPKAKAKPKPESRKSGSLTLRKPKRIEAKIIPKNVAAEDAKERAAIQSEQSVSVVVKAAKVIESGVRDLQAMVEELKLLNEKDGATAETYYSRIQDAGQEQKFRDWVTQRIGKHRGNDGKSSSLFKGARG